MQTKLICSDIDGTLLNKDRELSTKTIAAIKDIAHMPFILISSRMPQSMEHLQEELDISHLPLICYNGGLIVDGEEVVQSTEINLDTTKALVDFCSDTEIHSSLYHGREWYVPGMDFWANRESSNTKVKPVVQDLEITLENWKSEGKGAHKIMCMGEPAELDALVDFIENNYHDQIIGYRSKPTYLEISPKSISKKTSLETLLNLQYPELGLHNVMAFGDNYNDVDMLNAVGVGVAVENAIVEAKDAADHRTACNIEDGVALFLEGFNV
ncbi:Cof-type HAD-IIB family hydrolase [Lutimonas sp.]|uniref:Cof-type HAD-IIB family hydrolase n=1 Tax=Lutimonas sp. TaxID=1872403 RepID=UPI003C760111